MVIDSLFTNHDVNISTKRAKFVNTQILVASENDRSEITVVSIQFYCTDFAQVSLTFPSDCQLITKSTHSIDQQIE